MRYIVTLVTAILILLGAVLFFWRPTPVVAPAHPDSEREQPDSIITYVCNNKKLIDASFYEHQTLTDQEASTSITGTVDLLLSDGRAFTLNKTQTNEGPSYSRTDLPMDAVEQFIFWPKGNSALVKDGGNDKSYFGCVATAPVNEKLPNIYHDGAYGYTIRYSEDWKINSAYFYQLRGPGETAPAGAKFTVPESLSNGTSLSNTDTGLSVESIPLGSAKIPCTADRFASQPVSLKSLTINDAEYSFASSSDAGAGNFYEEYIFALPYSQPCTAIRYFVHSTNISNYDPGTVREFDRTALLKAFDEIRDTLMKR